MGALHGNTHFLINTLKPLANRLHAAEPTALQSAAARRLVGAAMRLDPLISRLHEGFAFRPEDAPGETRESVRTRQLAALGILIPFWHVIAHRHGVQSPVLQPEGRAPRPLCDFFETGLPERQIGERGNEIELVRAATQVALLGNRQAVTFCEHRLPYRTPSFAETAARSVCAVVACGLLHVMAEADSARGAAAVELAGTFTTRLPLYGNQRGNTIDWTVLE